MKIICFGDSITAGQHVHPSETWPALLPGHVQVRTVNGDTTRQALERFPRDVQESGADVVLIQFGHNDANAWDSDQGLPRVSVEAFRANLVEMIARAWQFAIRPILLTPTPVFRDPDYQRRLERYAGIVREVGQGRLCDVRQVFSRQPFLSPFLLGDGLHLSREGHRLYADAVELTLERKTVAT